MAAMPDSPKADLVRLETQLSEAIVEELEDKLKFHWSCPYSAISMMYGEFHGGCRETATFVCEKNCNGYGGLMARGFSDKLHRVAHLIYGSTTECRKQLNGWMATGGRLFEYSVS